MRIVWAVLHAVVALIGGCAGSTSASLEPGRIVRGDWESTSLRIVGLAPSVYLVTGPDGVRMAPDLSVRIGDVDATPTAASAAGIDVMLGGPLAVGFHALRVHARGRDFLTNDALEIFEGTDAALQDASTIDASAIDAESFDVGVGRDAGAADANDASSADDAASDGAVSDAPSDDAPIAFDASDDAASNDATTSFDGASDDAGGVDATTDAGSIDAGLDGGAPRRRPLAAGGSHTCAASFDGRLHCLGANDRGQLGTGGTPLSSSTPLLVVGLAAVVAVDAGVRHTCAIVADLALWCWGDGTAGQLGLGDGADHPRPTRVGLAQWAEIATGDSHSCGIQSDGSLWCWGSNPHGQLGLGTATAVTSPARVGADVDWVTVAAGQSHTCAMRTDSSLWCWGRNTQNQLGDGTGAGRRTSPTWIASGVSWSDVAGGDQHTCAVRADSTGFCWGAGLDGRLGTGGVSAETTPAVVVGSVAWAAVTAGTSHTCGLGLDGSLWCWGSDLNGELGTGPDVSDQPTPQHVLSPALWTTVDTMDDHTCGFALDGTLYCWGRNSSGETGAVSGSSSTPNAVALP